MQAASRLVAVPQFGSFWRKLAAFSGPGYLIAVGYMDPGNWATDLAGGSHAGYLLLSVVVSASIVAMVLQYLSIKVGIATGRNLAQLCSDTFPRPVNIILWMAAETMIIACDLAEVIGTAIGLGLLFHLPLPVGLLVTGLDVFILMLLQSKGMRYLETIVVVLIATVVGCFGLELLLARPEFGSLIGGLVPTPALFSDHSSLLLAIGIIGATIMPHNLYLHSSLVHSRQIGTSDDDKREAIKFATIDSTGALMIAMAVNVAILIIAAATFYAHGLRSVTDLTQAAGLLAPLLDASVASILFAVALLASGLNSTVTATMAGQVIMEGFINLRINPKLRRMITRGLAIIPAIIVVFVFGSQAIGNLLIASQVVLCLQLPLALIPLIWFTSRRKHMGVLTNSRALTIGTSLVAVTILIINGWLVIKT